MGDGALTHKDLDVYKKSVQMVAEVYLITAKFPKEEIYGLVSQMRRAAVSVPSNIAEGAARNSHKEFVHFLYFSMGSLSELETQLEIAVILNFIKTDATTNLVQNLLSIKQMLLGLIKSLKTKL